MSAEPLPLSTVNDVIAAYLKDRENKFSDRPCKHPGSLTLHFVKVRALWGEMALDVFQKGSKGRCKEQVQDWRRAGMAVGTCRKRISQLKTAFKFCVEEELIPASLMPVLKLPPQGAPRERVLTMEELSALLWEADQPSTEPHIRLCIHLSLRTAQRQSAIHDLHWDLIDFDKRVIRYRDTEAPGERSLKRRTDMPMDDKLFAMLAEAKENADTEWVLERHGKRVNSCYAGVKAVYARAGIKGLTRHDLRRSAATMLYRITGGDMKAAANFIGDTEEMAAKHYAHSQASDRMGPVQAISDLLEKARKSA